MFPYAIMLFTFSISCFSDELLLQDDGSDVNCMTTEFGKGMDLGSAEPLDGAGRFNHWASTNSNMTFQR